MKVVIIGAGSFQFGPKIIVDIYQGRALAQGLKSLVLMDINVAALSQVYKFAQRFKKESELPIQFALEKTDSLDIALEGANFVIVAIEVERYKYWAQDFHIPRDFGFKQVYAENGGPGGMFHALRNFPTMLEIAKKMEVLCPDAWLLNFTNPESKIIQLISRETKIKALGLCHGVFMGLEAIVQFLKVPKEQIEYTASGLNHLGWFTSLKNKITGEDLYPALQKNELEANILAHWDELALIRILFRTFGLWPYPGANHCAEYLGWAEDFLAGALIQYFHDPVFNDAWDEKKPAAFIYSMETDLSRISLFANSEKSYKALYPRKNHRPELDQKQSKLRALQGKLLAELLIGEGVDDDDNAHSEPLAVQIIEGLVFGKDGKIAAINYPNQGTLKGLPDSMVIEASAKICNGTISFERQPELPSAINEIVRLQGVINELLVDSYLERSRKKLLQAVMLDPTTPSYKAAVSMINKMFLIQKNILPQMEW